MYPDAFAQLLAQRWEEAQKALGLSSGAVSLTWELTDNYPHFHTPRGYGVTFGPFHKPLRCHLAFATKIVNEPESLQDGIIRHELGHVLDMCTVSSALDRWARSKGYVLPPTKKAERRADSIAEAIWRSPIRYDSNLVQSTTTGVYPRPLSLPQ